MRCQHCYADIYQPVTNGWWRAVEDGDLVCEGHRLRHEPLPPGRGQVRTP